MDRAKSVRVEIGASETEAARKASFFALELKRSVDTRAD